MILSAPSNGTTSELIGATPDDRQHSYERVYGGKVEEGEENHLEKCREMISRENDKELFRLYAAVFFSIPLDTIKSHRSL